jgi:glycosyltransferase involved in cell wall biosynthesis
MLAGRVTDEELQALYTNASLFCLPSIERSEAFGVVLLEAMSYGLPIVATDIPGSGVSWVNAHEVSGLNVEVKNPEAIATSILKIMKDSELREKFSRGARLRFEDNFTSQKSCDLTLAVYRSLFE